jgi:hypothetical protein
MQWLFLFYGYSISTNEDLGIQEYTLILELIN